MKSLLLWLMMASSACGASLTNTAFITLAWDRSPDDYLTNGILYNVYAGTNLNGSVLNSVTNFHAGTNTMVSVTNLPAATWYFACKAWQGGLESDYSNMVTIIVPKEKPRPPGSMGTMYLDMTLDLINYSDVGMFRARIFVPSK